MGNAMTDKWLKELDEVWKKENIRMELSHRVMTDPEYVEAQEKYKAICEGLEERRKIALKEETEVFNRVMERIAKEMNLTKKEDGT